MLHVGLTGGLASGKTYIGKVLQSLGCYVIHADALGHQVLEPGGAAFADVVAEFGEAILFEGRINRGALAALVFPHPERLERLNNIVHPHVFALEEGELVKIEQRDPQAIAVVEAAILIETGSYKRFDKLIVAICRPEQQIERAMASKGMTEAAARERLARQMPIAEKAEFADYIIDTSGTFDETEARTREVYRQLRSLPA